MFLEKGRNLTLLNHRGRTALPFAQERNYSRMTKMLKKVETSELQGNKE